MGAGGVSRDPAPNNSENKLPREEPGRLATGTPWCAPRITRLQISTGRLPPVTCLVGVPSSLPSQTPVTRFAVYPINQASRKSWLVPVFPAAGQPGRVALCAVPLVSVSLIIVFIMLT